MPRSTRTAPSDSQRAERRRADRELARQAVERLRSSDGWQRWLASRRHFHRYSMANQLLIAMQKPDATRVAGFRAWLRLGYSVRKGQRAIRIWVPTPPSHKQLAEWEASGADPVQRPRTHFRLGPVFDRSQVTELPPPARPMPLDPPIHEVSGDELAWALEPLSVLAGELGCGVAYEAMAADHGGYYRPADRAIRLAEGKAPNHSVHTLIHELAHALVAAERRDAPQGEPQGRRRGANAGLIGRWFPRRRPPNRLCGIRHNRLYVPRTIMLRTRSTGRVFPAERGFLW